MILTLFTTPQKSTSPSLMTTLVAKCIQGDRRAQETFYRTYYPLLLGICRRYATSNVLAAELVNQTFARAFTKLHQFAGKGSIEGWLTTVCVSVCLNAIARGKQSDLPLEVAHGAAVRATVLDQLAVEDLVRLIQQLSAVPRAVFNLVLIEGYSHAEAAARLNITVVNSRYHLRSARVRLRQLIERTTLSDHE